MVNLCALHHQSGTGFDDDDPDNCMTSIQQSTILESEYSDFGAFGYLGHETLLWFVLLAFIAGILGHTGLNYCLKYVSPLLISISVTLEPVLGSIIGWMFFSTGVPGLWTWIGGPILMLGIISIVYGEHLTNQTLLDNKGRPEGAE